MYTMVIDTETTGLPEKNSNNVFYNPDNLSKYENSRLVEIGYIILCGDRVCKTFQTIVRYDSIHIANSDIHGITTEFAIENGVNIITVLKTLEKDLEKVERIVAHNADFDLKILLSEAYRYSMKSLVNKLKSVDVFCTCKNGMTKLNLQKHPKLIELCTIFNITNYAMHTALGDCIACSQCYLKLI